MTPARFAVIVAGALVACGGKAADPGTQSPDASQTPATTATTQPTTGQDTPGSAPTAVAGACPGFCRTDSDCAGCDPGNSGAVLCCDSSSGHCYESVQSFCNLGTSPTGSTSPATSAAPPSPPMDAGSSDHCAGALHLAPGGSISGTTCTGTPVAPSICTSLSSLGVWVYVDAPDGGALTLTPSPGVSISTYAACDSDMSLQCAFAPTSFQPTDTRIRLFGISRSDTTCGTFTLSATVQ